jgi:lysophospholipase L1-like esterase
MEHNRTRLFAVALALSLVVASPAWQTAAQGRDHWVATWATAQQLDVPVARGRGPATNIPTTLNDQTIRMVVRASIGGRRVRVALSNMLNTQPLHIGAAHVARHTGNDAIATATTRALSFGGKPDVIVPPGALLLSDPVDMVVTPLMDMAVSVYLPRDTGPPTTHILGLRTAYVGKGNLVSNHMIPEATATSAYLWVSSVDVLAPANSFAIVALGDSITDGYATTIDANQAWPTLLARRLSEQPTTRHVAVVNQGISGNQVLRNGAGLSALARFDRDVLSRPGVKWLILLEGINDINIRGRSDGPDALTADELIGGYQQIIARAHAHGIKIVGATLTPEEGVPTASDRGEAIRQAVNAWIRTSRSFDFVVDFDKVLRDEGRPSRLRPEFDPGDHIHPNDLGNRAMAQAFDLSVFAK